jgi:hypothetical protein
VRGLSYGYRRAPLGAPRDVPRPGAPPSCRPPRSQDYRRTPRPSRASIRATLRPSLPHDASTRHAGVALSDSPHASLVSFTRLDSLRRGHSLHADSTLHLALRSSPLAALSLPARASLSAVEGDSCRQLLGTRCRHLAVRGARTMHVQRASAHSFVCRRRATPLRADQPGPADHKYAHAARVGRVRWLTRSR